MNAHFCRFTRFGWFTLLVSAGITAGSRPSVAAPQGGEVTAGAAQILGGEGGVIVQQSTHRAILRWDDFSLTPSEFAQFVVPSADAATLNRVTGGMVSRIDGSLSSNGRLFLLNPNGILVGPRGTIDTAGFLGSAYNLADEDFLDGGDFTLSGDSTASVVNRGTIRAVDGDIFLFGHTVENHGGLEAPLGTVGLAAGKEIRVMESGQERISVSVSEHSAAESPSVTHTGTIDGAVAELKAHGNMYALAINHEGVTRATGAVKQDGRVILSAGSGKVRQSGTVRARNPDGSGGSVRVSTGSDSRAEIAGSVDARGASGNGGSVEVRGGEVAVEDSARIDVSGPAGGGSISIGKGPATVPGSEVLSHLTTVEAGGALAADALLSGSGGTVAVASVGGTAVHGSVRARGAGPNGTGGDATYIGVTDLRVSSIADLRGAGQGEDGLATFETADLSLGPGLGGGGGLPARFSDEYVEDQLRFANVRLAALGPLGEVDAQGILHVEPGSSLRWFGEAGLELYGRGMVHVGAGTDILNIGEGAIAMIGEGAGGALPEGTPGVLVENAVVRTTEGNIAVSGTGSPGGAGVVLRDGAVIESTEGLRNPAAGVFIEGRAVAGQATAGGIVLQGADSAVRSGFGGLRLSGEGSAAVQGVGAAGISVEGMVESLGAGPNASGIVLEGIGSSGLGGHGIVLAETASIEAASAGILLAGRTLGSGDGIVLRDGAQIASPFAGLVRLLGRSAGGGADLRWDNLLIAGKSGGLVELDGSAVGGTLLMGSAGQPGDGFAFNWNGGGEVSGDVDFYNSGGVTLAIEEGDVLEVGGSMEVWGGPVSVRGSIVAGTGIRFDQSPVLLAGSTWLASAEGNILLGPVDGRGIALGLNAPLGEVRLESSANVIGDLTIRGNRVWVVENDAITQSGAWMTGETSLDAQGNEIELSDAGNVLGALVVKGGKVALLENDAITQSGAWMTGETSLDSQGNEIDLNDAGNVLGAVVLKGGKVTLLENDAITQSGAWMTGETSLDSQGNEIDLNDVDNVLGALVIKGGKVTLVENDAITQGGAWMTGETSLDSQGNEIDLSNAGNVLGALVVKGGRVTLVENDAITQSGAWRTGETSLDAQGNEIDLSDAGNVLGALVVKGGKVTLVENDAITQSGAWMTGEISLDSQGNEIDLNDVDNVLGALVIKGGKVTLVENDAITQSGAWMPGETSLDSQGNEIDLNDAGNVLGALVLKGGKVTLVENDAITQSGAWMTGET
ncbi:MAG TPA: filamentous hemagglutinin N-terminal domain-containing protein, partial [Verrucomicrobiales bacterium]|nr:filamentous hemagglutinin N-terminal domain-containing protein [Verrucomicrobiales bacterium]